jgi:hypothetical protein
MVRTGGIRGAVPFRAGGTAAVASASSDMSVSAEADAGWVEAQIKCDGRDGDCPASVTRRRTYRQALPSPTTGHSDDPAWAPLREQSTRVQRIAGKQGWRVDSQGEFCPDCAPQVREDEDEDDWGHLVSG